MGSENVILVYLVREDLFFFGMCSIAVVIFSGNNTVCIDG